MSVMQATPISIPSSSKSNRSHFRRASDLGSHDLSHLSLTGSALCTSDAAFDVDQANRLAIKLASLTVEDILSSQSGSDSRLVVLAESVSIEAAGTRFTEQSDQETWILLKKDGTLDAPKATGSQKLRRSDCTGMLGLEDLAAFFTLLFGQQNSRRSSVEPTHPHGLASPPPSPRNRSSKKSLWDLASIQAQRDEILAKVAARQVVPSATVSNLSGSNRLEHVSLDTDLTMVLTLLCKEDVRCVVVSDTRTDCDGLVCGIVTATDLVSYLVAEADKDSDLAVIFSAGLDDPSVVAPPNPVGVISGDKSVVDALVRMQTEDVSIMAVMDPIGGFLSSVSAQEIAVEILRSSSKKILTTPLSLFIKTLRSRQPQGIDGKDSHPAIRVGTTSSVGRTASLLLATASKGVFVVEESRVAMTPPLSSISASPGKEVPSLTLEPETLTSSRSMAFPSSLVQKQRRASMQFWTSPRSYAGETARPGLPSFASGGSAAGEQCERRLSFKVDRSLSSRLPNGSKAAAATTTNAPSVQLRSPSLARSHRPRSLSLAQFAAEDMGTGRQASLQAAWRSQGAWTPSTSTLTPGSTASSSGSPSSPFGGGLISGFFGESLQSSMPRRLVTLQTILRAVLSATSLTDEHE